MPLLVLLALVPLFILLFVLLMPVSLVMRYRAGSARRQARGWMATLNVAGLGCSTVLFLLTAALTTLWVPGALVHAVTGLGGGLLLGLVGLWLSRWETTPEGLHYTPNRWVVLGLTVLVCARVVYGFWRGFQAWRVTTEDTSWLAASGAAGSLAAGALVLGYYLMYWSGVRRRLESHRRALELRPLTR